MEVLGCGLAFTELGAAGKSALVQPGIRVDGNKASLQLLNMNWIHV